MDVTDGQAVAAAAAWQEVGPLSRRRLANHSPNQFRRETARNDAAADGYTIQRSSVNHTRKNNQVTHSLTPRKIGGGGSTLGRFIYAGPDAPRA